MASPRNQSTQTFIIPPGEAQQKWAPSALAWEVRNFERTPEGTLKSVTGPTPYEPSRGDDISTSAYITSLGTTEPHSIFQAQLQAGTLDLLLVRSGSNLFAHAGWYRGWEYLKGTDGNNLGLSSEGRSTYPDQYVVFNDKVIFTNGINQALVISHDRMVVPLGFAEIPGPLTARGPTYVRGDPTVYPNVSGYSWPGRKGTVGGLLQGQQGSLLDGAWYATYRYEDPYGNLSAPAPLSNPVLLRNADADQHRYKRWGVDNSGTGAQTEGRPAADRELDDLLRQFAWELPGDGPTQAVAAHIYVTPDAKHASTIPRFHSRIPNPIAQTVPDSFSDAELGREIEDGVPVPVFKVMCAHQGRLVIGNILGDPGRVMRSEVGFPGTFKPEEYVYPDSGGAEVTAVVSHAGVLLAFTASSVYVLEDFGSPKPLARGVGCVAPRSFSALANGMLIWLADDGFYGLPPGGLSKPIPLSEGINPTITYGINQGRRLLARAATDKESGEYRCALAPAGEPGHTLMLTFDGEVWKRQELGIHIADTCTTMDWRGYQLALGFTQPTTLPYALAAIPGDTSILVPQVVNRDRNEVFVLGHETDVWDHPDRSYFYRSGWLRGDNAALSMFFVRTFYIGLVDIWEGTFDIRFYRNGSWNPEVSLTCKAHGPVVFDEVGGTPTTVLEFAGAATVGTSKFRDPRVTWRQVPVGLRDCHTWAFEIEMSSPGRLHLAAFAFDIGRVEGANVLTGRIPRALD